MQTKSILLFLSAITSLVVNASASTDGRTAVKVSSLLWSPVR
jgi:hypothetical protein